MRRRLFRLLFALPSLLLSSQTPFASELKDTACTVSLPSNVVVPDGRLIRGLNASQFVAQAKHGSATVIAATEDSEPRRILLVLETGRHVPERVRAAEYNIVADMLSEARSEDAFGLLTARGPKKELRFGQSRDAILAAVKELQTDTHSKGSSSGVLDTLMAAAVWFAQPKPGDAILLMSMGFESKHDASFKQVYKQLTDRRVRVFSLLLGTRLAGTISGGMISFTPGQSGWIMTPNYYPNREDEGALSWGSGGYSVQVDIVGSGQWEQRLTTEKLEALKTAASRMQSAITEYYRLDLNSPQAQITLGLTPDVKNKVHDAVVIYPRHLPACIVAVNP